MLLKYEEHSACACAGVPFFHEYHYIGKNASLGKCSDLWDNKEVVDQVGPLQNTLLSTEGSTRYQLITTYLSPHTWVLEVPNTDP